MAGLIKIATGLALLLASVSTRAMPVAGPAPLSAGSAAAAPAPCFRTVVFHEDFSDVGEGGLPSPSRWQIDTGTSYPGGPPRWGTNEVQTYTRAQNNLAVTRGNLLIRPQRAGNAWTSARIETTAAHDFACAPGQKIRVEGRIRVGNGAPAAQLGVWPAFWTLGSTYRGH